MGPANSCWPGTSRAGRRRMPPCFASSSPRRGCGGSRRLTPPARGWHHCANGCPGPRLGTPESLAFCSLHCYWNAILLSAGPVPQRSHHAPAMRLTLQRAFQPQPRRSQLHRYSALLVPGSTRRAARPPLIHRVQALRMPQPALPPALSMLQATNPQPAAQPAGLLQPTAASHRHRCLAF